VSRRHTSGFDILGMDRDPTPGDPDRIDELARFYEEIRDDAQTGVRVLGRGGSLSRARGESMEKLRDMLGKLPGKLQQTVDSFDAAAQAYRTYARVLRDQQTRIDTAMEQALEAVSAARRVAPRAAADATPDQIAEVRAAADEITGANARLSAAQRLAADARRLREQASARCRAALDDAADKAIKPPPRRRFFQRIGDFFRNNPIFRLIIDIVIAVVGVVLPVVGIVLAAVALVVTAAVQAANGKFELGTLLVGLVTLVPGAKLLGPLVRGAKSVAPGLVKTVSSGAQAFGRIGQSNSVIKGALSFGGRTGALGRQAVAEFGKGVVEEVATVGLNKLGNPNSEGFNLASIAGGAAAGAAFGTAFDGFRKGSGDGFDLDGSPGGGTGTTQSGGTPSPAGPSADTSPSTSSADGSASQVSADTGTGTSSASDSGPTGTAPPATGAPGSVPDAGAVSAGPTAVTQADAPNTATQADVPNTAPVTEPGPAVDRGTVPASGDTGVAGAPPVEQPTPAGGPVTPGVQGGTGAVGGGTVSKADAVNTPEADSPAPTGSGPVDEPGLTESGREAGRPESLQPDRDVREVAATPATRAEDVEVAGSAESGVEPSEPSSLASVAGDAPASSTQATPGPAASGDRPDAATAPAAPAAEAQAVTPPPPPPPPPPPGGASTGSATARPESGRQGDAGSTTDADAGETREDPIEERAAEAAKAGGSGLASDLASDAIKERQGEEPEGLKKIDHGFVLDEDDDTGFTKKTRR
jgi:hypothetical protein